MTASATSAVAAALTPSLAVARRLRPLQVGIALQNVLLWVPIEKMFMLEIGFNAATIGLVAAVYAAMVPLFEVPSGILADRWSRTGVMAVATCALAASALVGGLSRNPAMYAVSAALLGLYFALDSGAADSIIYDTLVEETGSSDGYEKWIGRLQVVESTALVLSALGGGLLADVVSPRFTFFATVPIVAAAAVAFLRCPEPRLHRSSERISYRSQAAATVRALAGAGAIRRVVVLSAVAATAAQILFEFGPLWLVSMHAAPVVYGPYWAALIAAGGVGGWAVSRVPFGRSWLTTLLAVLALGSALVTVTVTALAAVIAAQIVLASIVTMLGLRAGFLIHEAVLPTVRAGVSSAAGTLSWATFLPVALLFGVVSRAHGVQAAGWILVIVAAVLAGLCPAVRAVHQRGENLRTEG